MHSPWRSRDFRLVWAGGFINDIGDRLLLVALPVYVFTKSGSGTATAILFVVELVAALILGPIGGSLVGRWDLRRTLIATNLVQAAALLPLLTVTASRCCSLCLSFSSSTVTVSRSASFAAVGQSARSSAPPSSGARPVAANPAHLLKFGYFGMGIASLLFWSGPTLTTQLWFYLVLFGQS